MSTNQHALENLCLRYGILAIYLFGSRADDGLARLAGEPLERAGSDLDVGVVFDSPSIDPRRLNLLQVELERTFSPLRVDLVSLAAVDPLFRFSAIDGHRVAVTDRRKADFYELDVMREAAELLPIQRQLERDIFGISAR
jgi:predicted nucleotidyltransferase